METMPAASTIDLSGEWRLRADPGNVGLAEAWWSEPPRASHWMPVRVPAAWQKFLGTHYHHVAWYRRTVELPPDWNWAATRLAFDAVATEARVWVNGREVGRHVGDYVPFEFDVSAFVKPGGALDILVRVDETLGHITKGFHDMLSLHHGGLWQPVRLAGSGRVHVIPDGVWIDADATTGEARVTVELDGPAPVTAACRLRAAIADPESRAVAGPLEVTLTPGARTAALALRVDHPRFWSFRDDAPALYTTVIELIDDETGQTETHRLRFGFRDVRVEGTRVLFNGRPVHIRGILHWGHEPRHMAPAPPPGQVRAEFAYLKRLGFNCVCLCMWYPPRHFFDIADEMGMLIWQEHPVWHSPMDEERHAEYYRLFTAFMRCDRNRPGVVIVSSTCEHPSYHPQLAAWWWETARRMLPRQLLQVQTASFAWSDPEQTDLYDEHTYENSNRWPIYLQDLQDKLATLPPKPFVMGETILFTSWPDFEGILVAANGGGARFQAVQASAPGAGSKACATDPMPTPPIRAFPVAEGPLWWRPAYLESGREWERRWTERYGRAVVERFKRQGDRHHLLGRKFQIEMFRLYPNHAALVMNHLRDVPQATCGFMDDLDHWRFHPEQTQGWLTDAPLLLLTPDHRRSFWSRQRVDARLAVSNFGVAPLVGARPTIAVRHRDIADPREVEIMQLAEALAAPLGEVSSVAIQVSLPPVEGPTRLSVQATCDGLAANDWDLWVFPESPRHGETDGNADTGVGPLAGVYRLDGLPFDPADAAPDDVEKGYSRGFGLPVRRWIHRLPDPAALLPQAKPWRFDTPIPPDAKAVVTHKLTAALVDFMERRSGRVILLASKTKGGLGTVYEWFFGQRPLVIEEGPLEAGDSEWIVDLLGHDLTRTYARMIPVEDLGLADKVDPVVRLVYTHDADRVKFYDMLFMAGAGENGGLILVSAFDHNDPAGRFLLERLIAFAVQNNASARARWPVDALRNACIE